jgi:hypothetical protein
MIKFELEDDEVIALLQVASVGAAATGALLGANARQMMPIFQKVQQQFNEQRMREQWRKEQMSAKEGEEAG